MASTKQNKNLEKATPENNELNEVAEILYRRLSWNPDTIEGARPFEELSPAEKSSWIDVANDIIQLIGKEKKEEKTNPSLDLLSGFYTTIRRSGGNSIPRDRIDSMYRLYLKQNGFDLQEVWQ